MALPDSSINHYKDGTLHGPVVLIVADDGRIGLHCTVDNQSWLLPSATPQTGASKQADQSLAPARRPESPDLTPLDQSEFATNSIEHFARHYLK